MDQKKCTNCNEGAIYFKCCDGRECSCNGMPVAEDCPICDGVGTIETKQTKESKNG